MENKKNDVISFLQVLKTKIEFYNIILPTTRKEFIEILKKLEIAGDKCIEVIKNLTYKDYSKGPIKDTINEGNYWEFGTVIKDIEIYIKINMGQENKQVICISFHESKYKITYPLKNK